MQRQYIKGNNKTPFEIYEDSENNQQHSKAAGSQESFHPTDDKLRRLSEVTKKMLADQEQG